MRVPSGVIADSRVGRRRTVVGLLSAYSLLVWLCAHDPLATSLPYMQLFAFGVGGCTGSVLSLLPTLPVELLPPRVARLGCAAIFTPAGAGIGLGPLVAGAIVEVSGEYVGAKVLSAASLATAAAAAVALTWVRLPGPKGGARQVRGDSVTATQHPVGVSFT